MNAVDRVWLVMPRTIQTKTRNPLAHVVGTDVKHWLQNAKVNSSSLKRRSRRGTLSRPISDTSSTRGSSAIDVTQETVVDQDASDLTIDSHSGTPSSALPEPAPLPWRASHSKASEDNVNMDTVDFQWLDTLYREGFEAVFGSWMEGISEEEETDGISGQACVHAALQQIQTLRARQRNLQFSGSKVSPSLKSQANVTTPDSIQDSGFINAESIVYWAALTFDTSASLTLNCRSLLSSGLFGFESELPWRLVRTCAKMFDENARQWKQGSSDMTDERANQIIAAGASWKLLGWKLTAIFKEALRDGHDESEVRKAYLAVVDSTKQFEATDRPDLLPDITDVSIDAENTVMNTLAFGLHNTFTLKRPNDDHHGGNKTSFTVPIVSIDPYPHHAVAGVQLLRKTIERDFGLGKITEDTYQSLLESLERTLRHLPQSSKSVQAA
ncbi:hypothetical protein ACHAPU_001256 [Fusarium lateritium]